ncbi:helix-turn-helix domain-containing protein [Candidatus Omnitrophota bacterium]
MNIGQKIKNLRISQDLTLKVLAGKAGVTISFLSQLERGLTSPSISSLEKIAQALNLQVVNFFQDQEIKEIVFVRKGAGRKVKYKMRQILVEALASGFSDVNMQSQLFTLGAGANLTKDFIPAYGEKFATVIKGSAKLFFDDKEFAFKQGDSIYYTATQAQCKIVNIGSAKAEILLISFVRD